MLTRSSGRCRNTGSPLGRAQPTRGQSIGWETRMDVDRIAHELPKPAKVVLGVLLMVAFLMVLGTVGADDHRQEIVDHEQAVAIVEQARSGDAR